MSYLYLTADKIGTPTGGGKVTYEESQALKEYAQSEIAYSALGRDQLTGGSDPWGWDEKAFELLSKYYNPRLTHTYSGCFSKTVKLIKDRGNKVVITCAAHRVSDSKQAHEELGIPYNYPHLTDPVQWKQYSQGYMDCDVLVVPSKHSELVVREQGRQGRVEVIPHGVDPVPDEDLSPLPNRFTVGYLGAVGADKGLVYLLMAWKKLNYKDAHLIIAGKDSTSEFVSQLYNQLGGGNVHFAGWQDKTSDFYNKISLYVQPSATEGFGIEILEAQAHSRLALCSDHAGACDAVPPSFVFPARNVDVLAQMIDYAKKECNLESLGKEARENSRRYHWSLIRDKYKILWKGVFS